MLEFRLQMAVCPGFRGVFPDFELDLLNIGKKSRFPFHTLPCHRANFSSNHFSFDVF